MINSFWPDSRWHESLFAPSAESKSCQRETEREREKKNSCACQEAHSRVRPEGLFSLGLLNPKAGISSAFLVPCFLGNVSYKDKLVLHLTLHVYDTLPEFCLLNFGQHLWTCFKVSTPMFPICKPYEDGESKDIRDCYYTNRGTMERKEDRWSKAVGFALVCGGCVISG